MWLVFARFSGYFFYADKTDVSPIPADGGKPVRHVLVKSADNNFPCCNSASRSIRRRARLPGISLTLLLIPFSFARAQNHTPEASDARVQQLYGEAKAAQAQGDLAGAAAKYESLLELAKNLGPAYNNLGSIYLQMREYSKAVIVLQKGLKIDPRMASARALLGISRYQMGDYEAARRDLEDVLRSNPSDNNAELFLANDLIKLGDFDSAVAHLRRLAQRQPEDQEVLYLLGRVHMKLSEEALSKLQAMNPDSVWVHEISGEIMEGMKNFDGALPEYRKAVELAPQQPGTHYALANAYWSIHMWGAARTEFLAELQNDPASCTSEWKLGNIKLEQREDPSEALDYVEKALHTCPNLAGARLDRGRALLQLNRPQDAIPELLTAEKSDPAEPSTHFLLAQALRETGKAREAQAEMQIFSKLEEEARAKTADRVKQILQETGKTP